MPAAIVRALVVNLVLFASFQVWAAQAITPIATARGMSGGSQVTVQGIVTVSAGTFHSFLKDQGFAIQDDSGGIYVSTQIDTHLPLHRRVRVMGKIDRENNLLILNAQRMFPLPEEADITPKIVTTGAIGYATQGLLITTQGKITRVQDDKPYGYSVYIDDGSGEVQVFIPVLPGFSPATVSFLKVGRILLATGFSGQYKEKIEVNPRSSDDLKPGRVER